MMKRIILMFILLLPALVSSAESGAEAYYFLNLPVSVSAAGVGGNSVSSVEKDVNLVFHNPAILSANMDRDFSVGYLRYIADINLGSAVFARRINDRSAWMTGVRYIDYGSMVWTSAENVELGTVHAQDMAVSGGYSWLLSEHWRAGSSASLVYSVLNEYHSAAVAVDIGLYGYFPNHFLSGGLVVKNLGSQIVSYNGTYEKMPIDLQAGISKRLAHAPLRLTLTAQQLLRWNLPYQNADADSARTDDFATALFKHLIGGIEFIPTEHFSLSLGYNYRRQLELKNVQRTPFGGFSAGFSVKAKKVRIGASYAKYHTSGGSLQMTFGMNAAEWGL